MSDEQNLSETKEAEEEQGIEGSRWKGEEELSGGSRWNEWERKSVGVGTRVGTSGNEDWTGNEWE